MDLENIKKFIELAKSEGVAELKYEAKDVKVSVNFNSSANVSQAPYVQAANYEKNNGNVKSEAKVDNSLFEIKSPFVGTFYAKPSPDKSNYVKVGDKISKGQPLCILEAMKIMNEIESETSGEIVEICVDNESLVEFGQVLFRVRN